jgi:Tol biopolymer transport system component/DNA-binding winged helix-turn-helix (wHTH) protein
MPDRVLTFGLFELDTRSRQLYRQGRRVRLQEQPLRLLEALIEEPGRLVSRQDLQQRLWPSDIHVDFDLGLTGAVKRLRSALDDSADNPRFIETVPKVGFRFIAPVQSRVIVESQAEIVAPLPATQTPGRRSRLRLVFAVAGVFSAVAVAYLLRPETPALRVTSVRKITNTGHAWTQESLMSDGARLYYTEHTTEHGFALRQVVLSTNEDTAVAVVPGGVIVRGLSPDRQTFTTVSAESITQGQASPVWLLPVAGGSPRRLGNLASNDFAWSPDGRALVFARDSTLVLSDAQQQHEHEIARVPGQPICPRWSPDASVIRFVVEDTRSQLAIWQVGADGRNLHKLDLTWPGSPMEAFGDWAPDNRYYVFSSRRGDSSDLWALAETADWWHRRRTTPVQLTNGPLSYYRPLPSPDGSQIFAVGIELSGELMQYDVTRRTFVTILGGRSADQVSFSRDGRWFTYVSYPDGTLWRARADGRDALQLTTPPARVSQPRYSPDGTQIVFVSRRPGELPQMLIVSAGGGDPKPVLPEPRGQVDPSWSASGDAIVFGRDVHSDDGRLSLLRIDVATRRVEKIAGTDGLYAPVVSPDGRWIAAQSSGARAIVVVAADTGERITIVSREADYPAWSADSQSLFFNTLSTNDRAVFRVHVPGGSEERIADVPFATRGFFGSWSGLSQDGSPLVLADRSRADVYVLSLIDR